MCVHVRCLWRYLVRDGACEAGLQMMQHLDEVLTRDAPTARGRVQRDALGPTHTRLRTI